jgi:replication factor C subunit 3/5
MNKGKGKRVHDDAFSDNLPWVEKYRPATLDDLVSHKDITKTSKQLAYKLSNFG